MWIVLASLRRPYTVWVGMLLVTVLGVVGYSRTPTDILPSMKMPVVVVFASYRGMPAPDMEQSVLSILERSLTRCDQLDHIESRALLGIGIIRIYFRPDVDPDVATSQVTTLVNTELQNLPPGMQPPAIFKYDASAIPVGQLVVRSDRADDKELLDLTETRIRDELAGIEGLASAAGVRRNLPAGANLCRTASAGGVPADAGRCRPDRQRTDPGSPHRGNPNRCADVLHQLQQPGQHDRRVRANPPMDRRSQGGPAARCGPRCGRATMANERRARRGPAGGVHAPLAAGRCQRRYCRGQRP